jgi:STE24 endopeptidase
MRRQLKIIAAVSLACVPMVAHAAAFDVDQASRAWLDTLQGPARAKSDAYFEGGYWLLLWGTLVSVFSDMLLLKLRLSARFRDIGARLFKRPAGIVWVTALGYVLAGWLITLPWLIYTDFVREAQYGLMNQGFGGWFVDALKELGLTLGIAPLGLMAIYAVIRRFPRNWWVLATGLMAGFMFIGTALAPVYIAPLFNKYTEMPAGPLRERIVAMAEARDIPANHIYVFDASKQSKRISANVSGIGPTIRISLNDNLLNRSSPQEVAAVMGHEMGHYKLNHVWWSLVFVTGIFGLAFFLASRIAPALIARHGQSWGVRGVEDPASLPVLGILLSLFGLLATPLTHTLIRVNESQADAFGLDVAKEPDAFASIAMKLSEYRKIEPGPVEEALFFDHPSGATRVRMAMQWKKDHVPNAQMVTPPPMPQPDLKDK